MSAPANRSAPRQAAVGRGAARHQPCARARRDDRAPWSQRRRQDHDLARGDGPCRRKRRPHHLRRRGFDRIADPSPRCARHRLHAGRSAARAAAFGRGKCSAAELGHARCRSARPPRFRLRPDARSGGDARPQGVGAERRPAETRGAGACAHRRHASVCCWTNRSRASLQRCRGGSPKSSACCAARKWPC